MAIQFDAAALAAVQTLAEERTATTGATVLSDVVSPLVIETRGWVVPLRFGFPRRVALGSLHDDRLATMARRWLETHVGALREILLRSADVANWPDQVPMANWYDLVASLAEADRAGMRPPTAADEHPSSALTGRGPVRADNASRSRSLKAA